MKKIIIPISTLFVVGLSHAQTTNLSTAENYVYTKTYITDPTVANPKTAETVQYFDGLGRPKQVVNVKASPLGRDVVTHIEYDGFGRQVKDFLPVPQSGTMNGAIVSTPLANATQTDIYGSEKIYAEKILENSPLDRIQQQIQVGNDWINKPVKFDYDANAASDYVRKYETTTTWVEGRTQTSVQLLQYFQPSQLYKNTITDEDGNKTIEFKNGQGQTLLVRKVLSATENTDTYYVYNEYNQLAFVIPPLASAPSVEPSTVENLYYQYRYDGRNRLVEKKLPGKGWEFMVYDKQDRLVATRDANLEAKGQWLYTKYDQFGRVAITGIGTGGTRSTEQNIVDGLGSNNVNRVIDPFFNRQGMDVCYGNPDNTYPNSSKWVVLLSLNYYDTYPTGSPSLPTQVLGQNVLPQDAQNSTISTKSFPTASYVKNIEDDNWTKNYTWYDQKGRPIGNHSINHLGGYTKTESLLDFSGTLQQAVTKHKRLDSDTERVITENFTYDHQNRLLTHIHQVDSNPIEYLAQNEYNPLSQLKTKKVGGTSLGTGLQTIDYAYNIRGWMTKINDPANLGNDLFGYKIKYNEREGLETPDALDGTLKVIPRFNGNIAEVDWKTATNPNDNLRRYGYVYDGLNRLKAGFYQNEVNPGANEFFEKITYDLNGNITNLKRSEGMLLGSATAMTIDNLDYNYTGNRLNTVTDLSGQYNGYPDTSGNPISYDLNGNMSTNKDKGILGIIYNILNLPSRITFYAGLSLRSGIIRNNTTHTYRSDGVKLTKIYKFAPYNPMGTATELSTETTEYLDGFQYKTGSVVMLGPRPIGLRAVLEFRPTSEGYFDFVKNKYIYNYTDHLGNVRLSYRSNENSIQVIEENNYYPFGLKHEGYNPLAGNPNYQYKYNGKELQETGMYDYGARFYMPDIGRWGVVDPLAETSRRFNPYTYAYNNPINFIDPDGREGTGWGLKDNKWQFVAGMQEGDAAYQQGGYSDFRADGSVEPNVEITNSTAENTGMTYLGFNGETSYMPADSNGSTGMLGLSNWFRDAISALTPNFNTNETFQVFTGGANETDPSTASKARGGDRLQTNDMFYQIFMFYGRNTQLTRGPIGFEEAFTQFGLDVEGIGNPFGGSSGSSSGSPSGATPIKSDTFNIWTTQATGLSRMKDGTPYGLERKNVRGFGLSKKTHDSLMKVSNDSTNYWNKQLRK